MKYTRILALLLIVIFVAAAHTASAQSVPDTRRNPAPAPQQQTNQPATQAWTDKATEPIPTTDSAIATDGTSIYVLGGLTYSQGAFHYVNNVQRYSPLTDSWTQMAPVPVSDIEDTRACAMNGKIYLMGGRVNGAASPAVRIYNVSSDTWSSGPDSPDGGFYWTPVVCNPYNNRVYIFGGWTGQQDSGIIRIYNADTDTWAYPGGLNFTLRDNAAGLLSRSKIILAGGYVNGNYTKNTYIYDIANNSVTPAASIPVYTPDAAYGIGADGKFYVAGGGPNPPITNAEVYDPLANVWTALTPLNHAVSGTAGVLIGTKFYVISGSAGDCNPAICGHNQVSDTDCANVFSDISNNIFYSAIHNLSCRGIVNGTSATTFGPSATSTRAQFAKVVVLGFAIPRANPAQPSFSDVPTNYFAYQFIEGGKAAGILSGLDAATCAANGQLSPCYLPNKSITRGQLTKLVISAAGYTLINPPNPTFSDVPTSSVFYQFIETAAAKGVVNGTGGGLFQPNLNITRDQMCQIVYKALITP